MSRHAFRCKVARQGRLVYELIEDAEEGKGLAILPLPSPADLFLDLEANPYVFDDGLEYLIGMATLPAKSGGEPIYESLWALTRSEERKAFEAFIAKVMEQWRKNPEMHIYHYAPYEPTAIKRLVGRHGTCVDEVDELLRAGVFVDLYRAVRQGIRASVESYSIKRLEPLYGFTRAVPLRDANVALQSFEAAMALGNGNGGNRRSSQNRGGLQPRRLRLGAAAAGLARRSAQGTGSKEGSCHASTDAPVRRGEREIERSVAGDKGARGSAACRAP